MGRGARRCSGRHGDPVAAIRIIAIGRATGPERDLFQRYAFRHRPPLVLTELPDGVGSPIEIKRREARALLAAVTDATFLVALDQDGRVHASNAFANQFAAWTETGRPLAFVLGGAEGLDGSILERADATLSLGAPTWPHLLARIMLAEQLYRARSILDGHPYHRAGRP